MLFEQTRSALTNLDDRLERIRTKQIDWAQEVASLEMDVPDERAVSAVTPKAIFDLISIDCAGITMKTN